MELDVVCPVYWVNEYFELNVESWIRELPVKHLIFGINNPEVIDNFALYPYFDQTKLKTLGACLVDLMKRVTTDWFVFMHSDARITPGAFKLMEEHIKPSVGIIESERLHWNGGTSVSRGYHIPVYTYDSYYYMDRAFSGFQIIQKKAIQNTIDKIEDDYIYRNEDLIFQYDCIMNGYEYVKTLAFHIHQTFIQKWTFSQEEAFDMQWRGLVKYTEPFDRITMNPCLMSLKYMKVKGGLRITDVMRFCRKLNKKKWLRYILKKWDDL
jgi:hypothetical protein